MKILLVPVLKKSTRRGGERHRRCFVVVVLLLAPWLAPFDPTAIDLKNILEPPSAETLVRETDEARTRT